MADRGQLGELAALDRYGSMPLSSNIEDRRGEPPLAPGMAEWLSRYRTPLPRQPVQTDDPMAVAAGYNWIGQTPWSTFAERFRGF